jgi:hypothetical protein
MLAHVLVAAVGNPAIRHVKLPTAPPALSALDAVPVAVLAVVALGVVAWLFKHPAYRQED